MGSRGRRLRESSVEADAIFAAGSISEALQYGCGTSEHERNVHEEEDGGETARTALVMSESKRVLFGLGFFGQRRHEIAFGAPFQWIPL